VQSQEHLVGDLLDLVLAQLELLDVGSSLEGVGLDAGQLVALQLQLDQMWQPTEEAIGTDASQFVVVEQTAE